MAAAQALRFAVFVEELGGRGGVLTDPARGVEADRFDPHAAHLLLLDAMDGDAVVGTARVMTDADARAAGGFCSEDEFDLARLRGSGRRLLEVSRLCLHPAHRGGGALARLWQGLAGAVEEAGAEVLFGLASFPGRDAGAVAGPLACLARDHLAPPALRPRSRRPVRWPGCPGGPDRRAAVLAMPPLVKAYLRLGARAGEGACLDDAFGCIDVLMVLDAADLPARARTIYAADRAGG